MNWIPLLCWTCAALLGSASPLFAQGETPAPAPAEEEEKKGGLFSKGGGILNKIKDKAPESVSGITGGLADLKGRLGENLDAMKKLQTEVATLKETVFDLTERVESLEKQLAATRAGAGAAAADIDRSVVSPDGKSISITAEDLSAIYDSNSRGADKLYLDTYLTVQGRVEKVKPGTTSETFVVLAGVDGAPSITCSFYKDADFAVETLEREGRLVNRADGTTFLAVGQIISVKGTCKGKGIDVELRNCQIDGMKPKVTPLKPAEKK